MLPPAPIIFSSYTTLDDPSASPQGLGTVAQGINATGLIVGSSALRTNGTSSQFP